MIRSPLLIMLLVEPQRGRPVMAARACRGLRAGFLGAIIGAVGKGDGACAQSVCAGARPHAPFVATSALVIFGLAAVLRP
jgi:hypothetical protein